MEQNNSDPIDPGLYEQLKRSSEPKVESKPVLKEVKPVKKK